VTAPIHAACADAIQEVAELILTRALTLVIEGLTADELETAATEAAPAPKAPASSKPVAKRRLQRIPATQAAVLDIRARILEAVKATPGQSMAEIARRSGLSPDLARYQARQLANAGQLRREGNTINGRWFLAGAKAPKSQDPDETPPTQRSERAPAVGVVGPEAAILAHLRKSPASLEGIRRACFPDWQEAPLGRLLHALKGRGLVEGVRGRAGIVTWRIKGAA